MGIIFDIPLVDEVHAGLEREVPAGITCTIRGMGSLGTRARATTKTWPKWLPLRRCLHTPPSNTSPGYAIEVNTVIPTTTKQHSGESEHRQIDHLLHVLVLSVPLLP